MDAGTGDRNRGCVVCNLLPFGACDWHRQIHLPRAAPADDPNEHVPQLSTKQPSEASGELIATQRGDMPFARRP